MPQGNPSSRQPDEPIPFEVDAVLAGRIRSVENFLRRRAQAEAEAAEATLLTAAADELADVGKILDPERRTDA